MRGALCASLGTALPSFPITITPRLFSGTAHESELILSGRCATLQIAPLDETSADLIEFDGEIEGRLPLEISITGHTLNVLKGSR